MRVLGQIDLILLMQRGHLFPWAPVFLALGIGTFFAMKTEPGSGVYLGLGMVILLGLRRPCGGPGAGPR